MRSGISFRWTRCCSRATSCTTSPRPTAPSTCCSATRRAGVLIPGNHDVPDEMRRRFGPAPFQVGGQWRTRNGWQVLLLESWFAESADGEGSWGRPAAAQSSGAGGRHGAACLRGTASPTRADGFTAWTNWGCSTAPHFSATVARHPRVRGVCWGHAHQALDIYRAVDVRFMCTPATGMQFKPRNRLRGGRPPARLSRDRPARRRLDRVRSRVARGLPRLTAPGAPENRARHGRRAGDDLPQQR